MVLGASACFGLLIFCFFFEILLIFSNCFRVVFDVCCFCVFGGF